MKVKKRGRGAPRGYNGGAFGSRAAVALGASGSQAAGRAGLPGEGDDHALTTSAARGPRRSPGRQPRVRRAVRPDGQPEAGQVRARVDLAGDAAAGDGEGAAARLPGEAPEAAHEIGRAHV